MITKVNDITGATHRIISALYNNGDPNRALLATLRTTSDLSSHRAERIWPILFEHLNHEQLSKNGIPTKEEKAIFTTIRLYAKMQQGQETNVAASAEEGGLTFMEAVREFRGRSEAATAIDRRVQAMLGTTNFDSFVNSLTRINDILKASKSSSKINYARLATDLYFYQFSYHSANRVRLQWGQTYYYQPQQPSKGETNHD